MVLGLMNKAISLADKAVVASSALKLFVVVAVGGVVRFLVFFQWSSEFMCWTTACWLPNRRSHVLQGQDIFLEADMSDLREKTNY